MPRRHDPAVFFIDRCLGSRDVADVLRRGGVRAEVHDDHFTTKASDVDWLPEVGRLGWVVLTKDQGIARHRLETGALMRAGVAAFVLTSGSQTGDEMAESFVRALPKMLRMLATRQKPFLATVSRGGQVAMKVGGERLGGIRR